MKKDLRFGLVWLLGLFLFDSGSSMWELTHSLNKVAHDPEVAGIVRYEVGIYVAQVLLAYGLIGLAFGALLVLLNRALPEGPARARRWVLLGGATAWIYAHGAILWPEMYLGIPGLDWYAGHVNPTLVTAIFLFLGGLLLVREIVRFPVRWGWLAAFGVVLALCSQADRVWPADTPQKNQGPNVLIIGFDALRPDHLASFGYARDTAPHLDAFLATATTFDHAFTPEARTWEAWMSILTGTYPVTTGMRWSLPAPGDEVPEVPMITEALQKAGYHTRFLTDDSRFSYMVPAHHFDVIDQPMVGIRAFAPSRYQPNFRTFFSFLNGPLGWDAVPVYRYNQAYGVTHRVDAFAEHVADEIAQASTHGRFFMAVHSCVLHTPSDRSYPYDGLYGMADYRGENRYRYRSYGSAIADGDDPSDDRVERLEHKNRQQNLDLYDSGLAMVDDEWTRISRALDEGHLWDNTLVVVISDHGEDFLEDSTRYHYRGPNHGYHPWGTGQARVMMAFHGPGFSAGRREDLVDLIDLAPTVARATDVALPSAEGLALQSPLPDRVLFGETGVSETGYWPDGHKTTPFRHASERYTVDPATTRVYQRHSYDLATVESKDRWAMNADYWLVEQSMDTGPAFSLFRWKEDPTFARDLIAESPDAARTLMASLDTWPRFKGRLAAEAATAAATAVAPLTPPGVPAPQIPARGDQMPDIKASKQAN